MVRVGELTYYDDLLFNFSPSDSALRVFDENAITDHCVLFALVVVIQGND